MRPIPEEDGMDNFRSKLSEWRDFDTAAFHLAVTLGVLDNTARAATEAKHVFWSSNALGDGLREILDTLVRLGCLQYDQDSQRFRWNPDFSWERAGATKGR